MSHYVLDACALFALLQDEAGADKVAAVINAANAGKATVTMHKVNLLEVYYGAYRARGKEQANLMVENLSKQPIDINTEITSKIFEEAGRLKASYKISLADSIALAQAMVLDANFLTADHHEFDVIEGKEPIRFHWIR